MEVADEIVEHDPRGLIQFVRLCGMTAVARFLSWRIRSRVERARERTDQNHLLFSPHVSVSPDGGSLWEICPESNEKRIMSLAEALVVPWPWNRTRLARSLASIGADREWGTWKHDRDNHFAELWLPLGIVWVSNGNHSITTGIIGGRGKLRVNTIRDISGVYDHVRCDGENFRRAHDSSVIEPVRDPEFAAIFEVGRLMLQHQVSA